MAKMTSAYANKVLRKLQEDKEFWLSKERDGYVYVAAIDEELVIPEYDYETVAAHIVEIDEKIVAIKHAINVVNATNVIIAGDNYDLELVKSDYERIDAEIAQMQIALDKFNQTFEFEVEV